MVRSQDQRLQRRGSEPSPSARWRRSRHRLQSKLQSQFVFLFSVGFPDVFPGFFSFWIWCQQSPFQILVSLNCICFLQVSHSAIFQLRICIHQNLSHRAYICQICLCHHRLLSLWHPMIPTCPNPLHRCPVIHLRPEIHLHRCPVIHLRPEIHLRLTYLPNITNHHRRNTNQRSTCHRRNTHQRIGLVDQRRSDPRRRRPIVQFRLN